MRIAAGDRLGRYEIIEQLGQGGMGEVYKARDELLRRVVAIKVVRADQAVDPNARRRFLTEAEMLAQLNHPRICGIYDIGCAGGLDFLVMEYLEGRTLHALLRFGRLSMRQAARYALEIAEGLAAAHGLGVIHRDLKPANIFVTESGAKLVDFGIARLASRRDADGRDPSTADATTRVTQAGELLGTPAYMAPEVLRGVQADARSDLFAYGAVLFELLTGDAAFQGAGWADQMNAVLHREVSPVRTVVPDVPPPLERLVTSCLAKDPRSRWQSAQDAVLLLKEGFDDYNVAVNTGAIAGVTFQRLTFQRGRIYAARFAPEGTNILYSAAWNGMPIEVFLTRRDSPDSRSLGLGQADLLAVSSTGTLAVSLEPQVINFMARSGVLGQVHLAAAQPRTLSKDIVAADWTHPGDRSIVVVRRTNSRCRLEWPIGRVVYETDGLISSPRTSRDGRFVAFLDHPRVFDGAGAVAMVDQSGHRQVLSDGWSGVWGLAWSADGREIWFAASKSGNTRSLRAVTLSGEERVVAQTTGSLTLHDIAPGGEVLVSEDSVRSGVVFRADDDNLERDLAWLDSSYPRDLSLDGTMLLFDETGDGGGPAYSAYIRPTDGRPAVKLGDGFAGTLSPDKRWASIIPRSLRGGISLVPTGPGESVTIQDSALEEYRSLRWLPDGDRVVFGAAESGRGLRLFVSTIRAGRARPISFENILGPVTVSPDAEHVIGLNKDDRSVWLFPINAADAPQLIPHVEPDEMPLQFSRDGTALYLRRRGGELPLRVVRLDLATGEKRVWREFTIADRAGVDAINSVLFTPDGTRYVLPYTRVLSDLFLLTGVR